MGAVSMCVGVCLWEIERKNNIVQIDTRLGWYSNQAAPIQMSTTSISHMRIDEEKNTEIEKFENDKASHIHGKRHANGLSAPGMLDISLIVALMNIY